MMKLYRSIPRPIRKILPAPFLSSENRAKTKSLGSGIAANLDNLLTCVDFCGSCPSKPGVSGEALFCSMGKSSANIEMKGCNCFECPLFEQCSPDSIGYLCKYGITPIDKLKSTNPETREDEELESPEAYLERFTKKIRVKESEPIPSQKTVSESEMVCIQYIGDQLELETNPDQTILETSLKNQIPHVHICGGRARCSTCRVIVLDGLENCSERTPEEAKLAYMKGFPQEVRLACQTKVSGMVKVRRLVVDKEDSSEAVFEGKLGTNIAGTEIEAAVLFSDIRSFTSFSEKNLPYDIIHILNRYFNSIGSYIDLYGGYIDKYMGDGIMVTFGLEDRTEHPAHLAMLAAQSMIQALDEFNLYLENQFHHKFNIGIGIHFGPVIVGNLGYKKKMEFTAIGDTVNTASRIESLNKKIGSRVLVSSTVFEATRNEFQYSKGYRASVPGKSEKIKVYRPSFDLFSF
jgi:class 3 adenylate cyclase